MLTKILIISGVAIASVIALFVLGNALGKNDDEGGDGANPRS